MSYGHGSAAHAPYQAGHVLADDGAWTDALPLANRELFECQPAG
jgi:hypothetical protein